MVDGLSKLIVKPAAAATPIFSPGSVQDVGLQINNVSGLVSTVVTGLISVAGLLFFVMLVWGGIQYVLSGGDKAQAQAAKDRITHALIGIVIVAAAFAIAQLIKAVLGVDATNVVINNAYNN